MSLAALAKARRTAAGTAQRTANDSGLPGYKASPTHVSTRIAFAAALKWTGRNAISSNRTACKIEVKHGKAKHLKIRR